MQIKGEQINTLVEALPYLRDFKGKTVVVKYGGNAMLNDDIKNKVLQDIVFLRCAGMRPIVVHDQTVIDRAQYGDFAGHPKLDRKSVV